MLSVLSFSLFFFVISVLVIQILTSLVVGWVRPVPEAEYRGSVDAAVSGAGVATGLLANGDEAVGAFRLGLAVAVETLGLVAVAEPNPKPAEGLGSVCVCCCCCCGDGCCG